jgi:rhodanese-related sulfurtransferase
MSVRELQRLLKRDAEMLLVDVRSEREFRGRLGHVEEAENVPLEAVYSGRFRFQRGRPLVFICRKGVRSLDAAEFMARRGYTAYSVDGGMLDWRRMKDGDGGGFRVLDGGEGC